MNKFIRSTVAIVCSISSLSASPLMAGVCGGRGGPPCSNSVGQNEYSNTIESDAGSSILQHLISELMRGRGYNRQSINCDISQGSCLNDLVNSGRITIQIRAGSEVRSGVFKLVKAQKCDEALDAALDANDLDLAKDVRTLCGR